MTFDGAPPNLETHRVASAVESIVVLNGGKLRASIRFVHPGEMAELHRFKGGDGPTNVLTFAHMTGADIAVCPQVAKEDSVVRGWDYHSELIYLCIHGCLHALGFDHRDHAKAIEMGNLERRILTRLDLATRVLDPYSD